MRKPTLLIPVAMIAFTTFPAAAQEVPRVLFCQGQCFGVAQNGDRVPVTKGTALAPGLRLETGPNSYAQVRFGPDNACGIGENARVRFESRAGDRDVVFLDQGRIRMIGGELIGRPVTKPVELRTTEGTIVLRSADIEVKTLPKGVDVPPMLVKLNVGDASIGGLPVTKDVVQGIVGGKILDRAIPIGDIALATPREPAPAAPAPGVVRAASPSVFALPVATLPVIELKPVAAPVLSPAIVAPMLVGFTKTTTTTALTSFAQPLATSTLTRAPVPSSMLVSAHEGIAVSGGGTTSLDKLGSSIVANPTLPKPVELTKPIVLEAPPVSFTRSKAFTAKSP